jgi:hypothetical protein
MSLSFIMLSTFLDYEQFMTKLKFLFNNISVARCEFCFSKFSTYTGSVPNAVDYLSSTN